MEDLKQLFEQAGISEEEFVKHFLEPIYPEQNPTIIDGIVYTEESDGAGGFNKVEQGPLEDVLSDNLDILLQLLKNKNIEEDIFIEWIAHHKTSAFDEKGVEKAVKDRLTQGQKPTPQENPQPIPVAEGNKSLLGTLVDGLKGLFTGQKAGDTSGMGEGRVLSEQQEMEARPELESNTSQLAELAAIQGEERTKKLSKEINIIDAVYDNFEKIIDAIKEVAKEVEEDKQASKQEKESARAASEAVRNASRIKSIGITKEGDLAVSEHDDEQNKKVTSSVRLVGRLTVIRERVQHAATQEKKSSMDKALKGAGKVSLGFGGKDANKAEKSKTPNDPSRDKDKSKEIG